MSKSITTIQDVVDVIAEHAPGWEPGQTVDTFKSGDPSQAVRGILITFIATLPVLRRAVELGANLVITHEPTYYNGKDETEWLEGDGVYAMKKAFIEEHGVAIWRFHDGPHRLKPDAIVAGMAQALAWKIDPEAKHEAILTIDPQTVGQLAQWCKDRLNIQGVRVAGNLETKCSRVGLIVGAAGGRRQIQAFRDGGVDVVICGESPEWEACEYVRDANAFGQNKALIVLGHANSEEAGMQWVAEWLRPLVPARIAITHVPAGDPFQCV